MFDTILLIAAVVCFLIGTFSALPKVNLTNLGLFFFVLTFLI